MNTKRKQTSKQAESKLSFKKTPFRVLDKAEMSEAKGGNAEMVLEMVLSS